MKPTYTGKRLASVVANQTEEFCGEVTVLDDGSTGSGMPLWLMLALAVGGASIFLL